MMIQGTDTEGNDYTSVDEMWRAELAANVDDPVDGWYGKAISYWRAMPATVNGVLGGLASVHDVDVRESAAFLEPLLSSSRRRALDCGAGIGRITKALILPLGFQTVDLIEPLPHMIEEARKSIDAVYLGDIFDCSLQNANLSHSYDLIVVQWVALYLTDADFVSFFRRCKDHLNPGGIIFVKENCNTAAEQFLVDKDDSSLTRGEAHYEMLFKAAELTLVSSARQREWPRDLFPIVMYAFH